MGPGAAVEDLIRPEAVENFAQHLPEPLASSPTTLFTLYGRNALFLALRAIATQTAKRTVLLPALICGVEAEAVVAAGYAFQQYRVDPVTLQSATTWVKEAVTRDTAVIVGIHYFGFCSEFIAEMADWCASAGIFMIEDCAHALGCASSGRPLGTTGDAAVFSLRKSLPLLHGGALVMTNPSLPLPHRKEPPASAVDFDALVHFNQRCGVSAPAVPIDAIYASLGRAVDRFGPRLPEHGGYELSMSKLARLIVQGMDVRGHLASRQSAFRRYAELFRDTKATALRPLRTDCPPGTHPPFFPVAASLGSERSYDILAAKGYRAPVPFWSLAYAWDETAKFPKIANLKAQLMTFPLTEPLSEPEVLGSIRVLQEAS